MNASARSTRLGDNEFFIRLHSSSVQYHCFANSIEVKSKWIQALCGERTRIAALIPSTANQNILNNAHVVGEARIAAFTAYYGHIDYYGFLYRKRKLTNRWLREFILLVDSEVHYYASVHDPVDQPTGLSHKESHTIRAMKTRLSSPLAPASRFGSLG